MLKSLPERPTYAQQTLIKLINARKLRSWCIDNALVHTAMYNIAVGKQLPTYSLLCSMPHLISPIDWLFYTDETKPYAPRLVPPWNKKTPCKFVIEHRPDWKEIALRYGLSELSVYNVIIRRISYPSLALIRKACVDTDPIDFFTAANVEIESDWIPSRGDIIETDGRIMLVLSDKERNEKTHSIVGCVVSAAADNGIPLENTATKGIVDVCRLESCHFTMNLNREHLIERANECTVSATLKAIRSVFE